MKHERRPLAFSGPSCGDIHSKLRNYLNPKQADEMTFIERNLPNFYDYMHDGDDDSGSEFS